MVVGTAFPTIIKNVESANANIILVCVNSILYAQPETVYIIAEVRNC